MDLYKKYKRSSTKDRALSKNAVYFGLALAVVLIIGAFGVRYTIENMLINDEINNLESYVANEELNEKYNVAQELTEEAAKLNEFKTVLDDLDVIFTKKDAINSNVLVDIFYAKPNDLTILTMSADGPIVSISYKSNSQTASARFVSGLKEKALVKEVDYDGYTYNESDDSYSGNVTLLLEGAF